MRAIGYQTPLPIENLASLQDIDLPKPVSSGRDLLVEIRAVSLKHKSLSLHWELMFTRSLFGTADISAQGKLLNDVSHLVEEGRLRTTLGKNLGLITAANLREAHALIESGQAKGKIVLKGFPA